MNKWSEIAIHTTHEAVEPVANILHEAGAGGVVIEDSQDLEQDEWLERQGQLYQLELNPDDYPDEGVILKAYLPVDQKLEQTAAAIRDKLQDLSKHDIHLGRGTMFLTEVDEKDWANAWKKYYKPVRISERITIVPTWEAYVPQTDEEQIIRLDPGMAFGTGTHPTTKLGLQALEKVLQPGNEVIDVGCGSGILSIAALKLGAKTVLALDIDDLAVKVAQENIEQNHLSPYIDVKKNDLLENITRQADVIVANILADVILRLVEDAYGLLRPGGVFITSGIIARQQDEVKQSLMSYGFGIEETLSLDGWMSFIARRGS